MIKIGDWYKMNMGGNMEVKVVVTAMNSTMVYLDRKTDHRMPAIDRYMMVKKVFLKKAVKIERP